MTGGTDPELTLAYLLYREKGLLPGEYYQKSAGEKLLLRAFLELETARPPLGEADG